MPNQVTEVVFRSWFSRLRSSVAAMLIGLVLTVAPVLGLFWNEKRAINMTRTLNEGARKVVSVSVEAVDPQNEGGLVHFSGRADSPDRVEDAVFGIEEAALKLRRSVETYQWEEKREQETRTRTGGGTETTVVYSYRKIWDDELADSNRFKEPGTHANPAQKLFPESRDVARPVRVGAFTLPEVLVEKLSGWTELPPPALEKLPADIRSRVKAAGPVLYFGQDPQQPAVGDTRVRFEVIRPHEVSVVARQVAQTLEPFRGSAGTELALLDPGVLSASEMFARAHNRNRLVTWMLRFGCFLVMGIGLSLLFHPLRVLADVLPAAGRLVGVGTGFAAFLLAAVFSSVTIAVAWVAVRPEVGIPLLIGAFVLVGWFGVRMRQANIPPPLPPQ